MEQEKQFESSAERQPEPVNPESLESIERGAERVIEAHGHIARALEVLTNCPGRKFLAEKETLLNVDAALTKARISQEQARILWYENMKLRTDKLTTGVDLGTPRGKYYYYIDRVLDGGTYEIFILSYRLSEVIRAYCSDIPEGILKPEEARQAEALYEAAEPLRDAVEEYKKALQLFGVEITNIRILEPPPGVESSVSDAKVDRELFRERIDSRPLVALEMPVIEPILEAKVRARYQQEYGDARRPTQADLIVSDFTMVGYHQKDNGLGDPRHSISSGFLVRGYFTR